MSSPLCDLCEAETATVRCEECAATGFEHLCAKDDMTMHRDTTKTATHKRVNLKDGTTVGTGALSVATTTAVPVTTTPTPPSETSTPPAATGAVVAASTPSINPAAILPGLSSLTTLTGISMLPRPMLSRPGSQLPSPARSANSSPVLRPMAPRLSMLGKAGTGLQLDLLSARSQPGTPLEGGHSMAGNAKRASVLSPQSAGGPLSLSRRQSLLLPTTPTVLSPQKSSPPSLTPKLCDICEAERAAVYCDTCKRDSSITSSQYCTGCSDDFHKVKKLGFHFRQPLSEALKALNNEASLANFSSNRSGSPASSKLMDLDVELDELGDDEVVVSSAILRRRAAQPTQTTSSGLSSVSSKRTSVFTCTASEPSPSELFKGTPEEQLAATKLQALYRGSSVRRHGGGKNLLRSNTQDLSPNKGPPQSKNKLLHTATFAGSSAPAPILSSLSASSTPLTSPSSFTAKPVSLLPTKPIATTAATATTKSAGEPSPSELFTGTPEEQQAATKLQALYRGSSVRKMNLGVKPIVLKIPEKKQGATLVATTTTTTATPVPTPVAASASTTAKPATTLPAGTVAAAKPPASTPNPTPAAATNPTSTKPTGTPTATAATTTSAAKPPTGVAKPAVPSATTAKPPAAAKAPPTSSTTTTTPGGTVPATTSARRPSGTSAATSSSPGVTAAPAPKLSNPAIAAALAPVDTTAPKVAAAKKKAEAKKIAKDAKEERERERKVATSTTTSTPTVLTSPTSSSSTPSHAPSPAASPSSHPSPVSAHPTPRGSVSSTASPVHHTNTVTDHSLSMFMTKLDVLESRLRKESLALTQDKLAFETQKFEFQLKATKETEAFQKRLGEIEKSSLDKWKDKEEEFREKLAASERKLLEAEQREKQWEMRLHDLEQKSIQSIHVALEAHKTTLLTEMRSTMQQELSNQLAEESARKIVAAKRQKKMARDLAMQQRAADRLALDTERERMREEELQRLIGYAQLSSKQQMLLHARLAAVKAKEEQVGAIQRGVAGIGGTNGTSGSTAGTPAGPNAQSPASKRTTTAGWIASTPAPTNAGALVSHIASTPSHISSFSGPSSPDRLSRWPSGGLPKAMAVHHNFFTGPEIPPSPWIVPTVEVPVSAAEREQQAATYFAAGHDKSGSQSARTHNHARHTSFQNGTSISHHSPEPSHAWHSSHDMDNDRFSVMIMQGSSAPMTQRPQSATANRIGGAVSPAVAFVRSEYLHHGRQRFDSTVSQLADDATELSFLVTPPHDAPYDPFDAKTNGTPVFDSHHQPASSRKPARNGGRAAKQQSKHGSDEL